MIKREKNNKKMGNSGIHIHASVMAHFLPSALDYGSQGVIENKTILMSDMANRIGRAHIRHEIGLVFYHP